MNAKTLTALNKSIAKYKRFATGKARPEDTIYSETCPLCLLFNNSINDFLCDGCPVKKRTGRRFCNRSPWEKVLEALNDGYGSKTFQKASRKEHEFLKSLLPKKK
jgi:hypothetical protein